MQRADFIEVKINIVPILYISTEVNTFYFILYLPN